MFGRNTLRGVDADVTHAVRELIIAHPANSAGGLEPSPVLPTVPFDVTRVPQR
jgi:hypothetical protein